MNIEALLSPISDQAPCGEDLSFSTEFDAIAELRREDDPTLAQGEWVTAVKVAEWPAVEARCADILMRRSKDLRVAMWLCESAAFNHGYAGLQQGLELCAQLCDRYWDQIHPMTEGADVEERVGNMNWLLLRIASLTTAVPVTRGRGSSYTLLQMQGARGLQASLERAPEKAAQLPQTALTLEKFNRSLRETPKEFLLETVHALQACQRALAHWQAVIEAKLGNEGPSFASARNALESALHDAQRLARDMGAVSPEPTPFIPDDDAQFASHEANSSETSDGRKGPLRSRAQALAQLREVAVYFRATEPHSPVAYLAEKAVQWGGMPLHEWLKSVVKEPGALAHLEELLGVMPSNISNDNSGSHA